MYKRPVTNLPFYLINSEQIGINEQGIGIWITMSNFAMGTILGKGFAQALVHTSQHLCLCKTLSQDCPHGEVAFSNSDINKKTCEIKICQIASFMSTMCKWHLMISFTHSRSVSTMCKWHLMISFTHSRSVYYV